MNRTYLLLPFLLAAALPAGCGGGDSGANKGNATGGSAGSGTGGSAAGTTGSGGGGGGGAASGGTTGSGGGGASSGGAAGGGGGGAAGGTTAAAPAFGQATVAGGVVAQSLNFKAVLTLGEAPGGNVTTTSTNNRVNGGLVGRTQTQ